MNHASDLLAPKKHVLNLMLICLALDCIGRYGNDLTVPMTVDHAQNFPLPSVVFLGFALFCKSGLKYSVIPEDSHHP